MQRNLPSEHRLKDLYTSPTQNTRRARLEIATIFKRTNFAVGKESKYLIVFIICNVSFSSKATSFHFSAAVS